MSKQRTDNKQNIHIHADRNMKENVAGGRVAPQFGLAHGCRGLSGKLKGCGARPESTFEF
jgi:hypothetical protein